VEKPNKCEVVAALVVREGTELTGANTNGVSGLDESVDTTGVTVVVGVPANAPKGVDVGRLGVTSAVEGAVELVTDVVRLVDGTEGKDGNAVPIRKKLLALVVTDLSNVVVPKKDGVLVVTAFSFVVTTPNRSELLTVVGFPVAIGVGDTAGVVPNNRRGALVDTGFSVVVVVSNDGDTVGVIPNIGIVELVAVGAVVTTVF
jgi:hypothetical protein